MRSQARQRGTIRKAICRVKACFARFAPKDPPAKADAGVQATEAGVGAAYVGVQTAPAPATVEIGVDAVRSDASGDVAEATVVWRAAAPDA